MNNKAWNAWHFDIAQVTKLGIDARRGGYSLADNPFLENKHAAIFKNMAKQWEIGFLAKEEGW